MNNADVMCARLAAGQNGMLTTMQLHDLGLSDQAIHRRRESGLLVPSSGASSGMQRSP